MSDPSHLPRGPLMADVEGLRLTAEERRWLCHPALGAVILFSRNYQSVGQVSALVEEIKALRKPALLVSVDQEGGRVQRFREGLCTLPPLASIGRCFDSSTEMAQSLAYDTGRLMALEIRQLGVDFSFAPVLDTGNPASSVIGDRALHVSARAVGQLASNYIDGMESAGMRATGKHFPGHGGVVGDSHHELPVDHRTLAELENLDLIPYRLLSTKIGAVMTAHVSFPQIDSQLPTFSSFWIDHILRRQIAFDGLVFSDDLTMKGAHSGGDPAQRALRAIGAGCDMVLVCNDREAARTVAERLGDRYTPDQRRLEQMAGRPFEIRSGEITALARSISALGKFAA